MFDAEASFRPPSDAPDPASGSFMRAHIHETTDQPDLDHADAPSLRGMPRQDDALCGIDARHVTPRRPLRFSFARSADDASPITLPVSNIFTGIFDEDDLSTAGVDPRLARSRHRARAILAAHEAALPAEAANLWHDFRLEPGANEAPTPAESAADSHATPTTRGRRPVRQITNADMPASRPAAAAFQDPLQDHLHRVRDALYAPAPEGEAAAAAARPSLPARLAAHTLNIALIVTALPLGVAMMIYTVFRGENLRLSARMVAVAGSALAVLQLGFDPLA